MTTRTRTTVQKAHQSIECDNCGEVIEADDTNGWVHQDSGLAGCGNPHSDVEYYATPEGYAFRDGG